MITRRPAVPAAAVLRNAWRFGRRPWIWRPMVALELGKRRDAWLPGLRGDGAAGPIRQLSLRLTDRCPLRCATCGQWGEHGNLHGEDLAARRRAEVPVARYRELLDDLARRGGRPLVYLWGGEPMLYGGVVELVEHASRLRMPVSMATNGTRVADAADALAAAPMYLLQVSVDGHSAALHDHLRPSAGGGSSFAVVEEALEAVAAARARRHGDLPMLVALVTVSDGNAGHLGDIYRAFRRRVDAFVYYLSWWIDEPAAAAHDADFERRFGRRPTSHRGWLGSWRVRDAAAVAAGLGEVRRLAREPGAPPVIGFPALGGAVEIERYYTEHDATFGHRRCLAIGRALEVTAAGDVTPCRDYPDYVVGNVKEHRLTELWQAERFRRFRRSLAEDGLMPVCARCCGLMGF